ncbi:uncharacterized protein LOC144066282 [Stigmatopora argus]
MPFVTRLLFVLLAPLCTNVLSLATAISAGASSQRVVTEMSPFSLPGRFGRPSPGLQSSRRYSDVVSRSRNPDEEPVQTDKNIGRYSVVILKSAPGRRIPTSQRGGPRFQSISAADYLKAPPARSPPSGAKTVWQKPSGHWSGAPRTSGQDASSFKHGPPLPRANVKPGQSVFQPSFVRREDFGKALNSEAFSGRNQRPEKHGGGALAQREDVAVDAGRYQARPRSYLPPNFGSGKPAPDQNSLWSRITDNSRYRFKMTNENHAPLSKYSFGRRPVEAASMESASGPRRLQNSYPDAVVGRSDKPTVKQVLSEREQNLARWTFTSPDPRTKPHPSQTAVRGVEEGPERTLPAGRSRLFGASASSAVVGRPVDGVPRAGLERSVTNSPIVRLPRRHASTTPTERRTTTARPENVPVVREGQNLKTESSGNQVSHIWTKENLEENKSELNYLRISTGNVTFESV